jgi:hypothetical protein
VDARTEQLIRGLILLTHMPHSLLKAARHVRENQVLPDERTTTAPSPAYTIATDMQQLAEQEASAGFFVSMQARANAVLFLGT